MAQINIRDTAITFTKAANSDLPILDNTRLTAVNTCPRWAGIRYGHNKTLGSGTSRALALECGTACHHAFAAIRLLQLHMQGFPEHAAHHAKRLFPKADAYMELLDMFTEAQDIGMKMRHVALFALEYSEYYDDPSDKKRTIVNMEEALIKYADRYNPLERKVWVQKETDPTSLVGIEIPFDYIIGVESLSKSFERRAYRFVGRIDGLSVDTEEHGVLEENKTTSQINASWLSNWTMAHQITGYMVVASAMMYQPVRRGEVIGLAIPQPKSSPYDGLVREHVTRSESQVVQWLSWFINSAEAFYEAKEKPLDAITYSHSCTRYFRECAMLPLCSADRDEQEAIFNEQMTVQEWNPLAEEDA